MPTAAKKARILEHSLTLRPRKNCLFPVMVRKKIGCVGQYNLFFFWIFFFWSKMCVLCIFYVDWELRGPKILEGRDFFE